MRGEWRKKALGEICRVIGGGTPPKDKPKYYMGDIPWATIRDMRSDVIARTEYNITRDAVEASSTNIIPKNNVVIATRVGLGKVCLLARDTAINQDLRGLIPIEPSIISVRFLFLWLKSIAHVIVNAGVGATVHGVKLPFVKALSVPLPPLPEQHRIVAILDEAFEGIATAKAHAEKNLKNARAVFESHLNAVFSQLGDRPKVAIAEVGTVFDGPHATPKTVNKGPIFLGIGALNDGQIDLSETRHISPPDYAQWTRRVTPQSGDVVFSYETRLGQAALIPAGLDCCLGRRMGLFRTNQERLDPQFFLYQYISPPFRAFLNGRIVRGATVDRISIKEFPSFSIWLPSIIEQKRVATSCNTVRTETQRLESIYQQKIVALDKLKQSLLHKAFAGDL